MFDALLPRAEQVCVWDLPLRLFHWLLFSAVATAAVSGFLLPLNWLNLHLAAGTAVIALLLFRLVWGFTGSTFSRFRSFLFSPSQTLAYLKGILAGTAPHHDGHNPVGAVMIFSLLGCLALIAATGLLALGGAEKQGPLRAFASFAAGSAAREIHALAAYALLVLVAGHIAGVIVESRRSGINLARAMVTGRKPSLRPLSIMPPRTAAFALAALGLAGLAGGGAYGLWRVPPPNAPSQPLDAVYARECGDCHIPFHPSLRAATAWSAIMATLPDHFGEDASLPPDTAAAIAAYLAGNAAERWDTRAANVFRAPEPLAITATDYWKRRHAGIGPEVFQRQEVGTKSNCEACHGDARQGLFTPQAISIPKE
jgi:cytochrome b